MRTFLFVSLLAVGLSASLKAADFNYEVVSQGDWAVLLVRALNLDEGKELNSYQDFTTLLTVNNVVPRDGWQAESKLSYADYVGTIGLALVQYNNEGSKSKTEGLNSFLSFLDEKIGISVDQLKSSLASVEGLRELNSGIDQYLATRQNTASTGNTNPAGTTNQTDLTKTKGNVVSSTTLAATVTNLSQALGLITAGTYGAGYWDVFSQPASPILPSDS